MKFTKLLGAVMAVWAISAIAASSAFGTVSTTRAEVYTGASPGVTLPVGTSHTLDCEIAEHPTIGSKVTLKTKILGKEVDLTAEGVSCSEAKIENKEITGKAGAAAFATGKVTFTNVTAMTPTGCTVSSEGGVAGMVTTKSLNVHADFMDTNVANLHDFVEFVPAAGAGTTFAQFKLSGGECTAIAGTYNVTGTVFGESAENTGVAALTQKLVFSKTVQETTGAALKVGSEPAELTGSLNVSSTSSPGVKELFSIKP